MKDTDEPDITTLLEALHQGDPDVADRLAARVQQELHRIAANAVRREAAGHTLQPTELVDEAFVRLIGQRRTSWQSRSHFFAVATSIIRRILVDHARRRRSAKRNHGIRVTLDASIRDESTDAIDLFALDLALQQLDALSPRQARVVELRFFGGLDIDETAAVLSISSATVKRDWTFARAFLLQSLNPAT